MRQLLGGLLLAAGILIAGASGLCSAIYAVAGLGMIVEARNIADALILLGLGLLLVLFVGGIPFAFSMALIKGGRRLKRGPNHDNRGDRQ